MITIVGFAGSLRQGSYNAALLRAARAMMPTESELHEASIREFPLYNGDDEVAHGVPPAVTALRERVRCKRNDRRQQNKRRAPQIPGAVRYLRAGQVELEGT